MEYRKKPVIVEATQWHKNGDHPQDNSRVIEDGDDTFLSEGKVVRRYNHPGGIPTCPYCTRPMQVHGWIDTVQGGHTVCPGDWILTEPDGEGFYPCKPDVFANNYELATPEYDSANDNTNEDGAILMVRAGASEIRAGLNYVMFQRMLNNRQPDRHTENPETSKMHSRAGFVLEIVEEQAIDAIRWAAAE